MLDILMTLVIEVLNIASSVWFIATFVVAIIVVLADAKVTYWREKYYEAEKEIAFLKLADVEPIGFKVN